MERIDTDPDSLNREEWNSLLNNYDKHDVGEAYFTGRVNEMGLYAEEWGIDMRHDNDGLIKDNKMDLRLWDGDTEPSMWPSEVPDMDDVGKPEIVNEWHKTPVENGYSYGYDGLAPSEKESADESWHLRGVVDIKTKGNEDWMCAFNVRHFAHYAHWADKYDVPVFLYFTMVDMEEERVGDTNAIVPVSTDWNYRLVQDHFDSDTKVTLEWPSLKKEVQHADITDRVSRAPDGNPVVWVDDEHKHSFDYIQEYVL